MAYDESGMWKPEDDSVETRLTGLMSQNSPLMKQAKTAGMQTAASRGLLNSSIAVGAAQGEAYKVATPIAQQDSAQTAQKNLSSQEFGQNRTIQSDSLTAQKEMQATDITSKEKMQQKDINWQKTQQLADIAAQKERLGLQLTSAEKQAAADRANAVKLETMRNDSAVDLKKMDTAAARDQQLRDIAFQESQKTKDRAQELLIANKNISEAQRKGAADMVNAAQASYQTEYQSIMNNTSLSADSRRKLLENAKSTFDTQMSLVEQTYNIDLKWSTGKDVGKLKDTAASSGTSRGPTQ